jgi:hypothetical protein
MNYYTFYAAKIVKPSVPSNPLPKKGEMNPGKVITQKLI